MVGLYDRCALSVRFGLFGLRCGGCGMSKILLRSGTMHDLLNPAANGDPIIEDIAHALANICRWTGHTSRFYSVAEHCTRAAAIAPPECKLHVLMHDAAEAYLGDVATPLKNLLPRYRDMEATHADWIGSWALKPSSVIHRISAVEWVQQCDTIMLHTEARDLMGAPWADPEFCLEARIHPTIAPVNVANTFINIFKELTKCN
jgi:uncharacterized protein